MLYLLHLYGTKRSHCSIDYSSILQRPQFFFHEKLCLFYIVSYFFSGPLVLFQGKRDFAFISIQKVVAF